MANKLIQHGGAVGATAATGNPLVGAAWEIGYPIVENWLTGGSDQDKGAEQQQANMQAAARDYQAYRPVAQQARQDATQQQLSAYNGAANAANLMYGTAYDPRNYAPNLGQNPLLTNPPPPVTMTEQPTPAPEPGIIDTAVDYAKEHPDETAAAALGPMGWSYIGAKKLWKSIF